MARKIIVCLANSIKHSGRCVAGIEVVGNHIGDWVRPIGAGEGHGVSWNERRCTDGAEPLPLDVIDMQLLGHTPLRHQVENWRLDSSVVCKKVKRVPYHDLIDLIDEPPSLWMGTESSKGGCNDRIPEVLLSELGSSIYLLYPENLTIDVETNYFNGVREVRADFSFRGREHLVKVTDPLYRLDYSSRSEGQYRIHDAYVTVSLTEPWTAPSMHHSYAYLVVAAVIERSGLISGAA